MRTDYWVTAALAGLGWTTLVAVLTWAASLCKRDASLVDRVWAVCIAGAGWTYLTALPDISQRGMLMVGIATLWALRLSLFITWRNWGHGEDRRYQAIRARNQPHFGWRSLYLVFGLQALLAWVVSAPLFAGAASQGALHAGDVVGAALAMFGFVFEAIADTQLARFKADAHHRGQVMDRGLWRHTRHPNYFGEACVWWGLWIMACGSGSALGLWSVLSPLLMTVLLLRVSGVRLLEGDIADRRPAYREYIARTNAFFPGPRKVR